MAHLSDDDVFVEPKLGSPRVIREEFNTEDQWSADIRTLRRRRHQQSLGAYLAAWKAEEEEIISNDDLVDAIIDEVNWRNRADLFDYNKLYLNPDERNIVHVLNDDTRHQIGRVLEKATQRPERRLQTSLVDFYMWLDLAIKCRESRRIADDNPTAS